MGSITAFIMLPFLVVWLFFGSLFGAITGVNNTKVELPYDEEAGLVWTCEENADWFEVSDVKVEGDKQIFTIKGLSMFDVEYRDYYGVKEEVVFTAENNEVLTYIAVHYEGMYSTNIYHLVEIYSPDEYGVLTYKPEASVPVEGAVWQGGGYENIYDVQGADGEAEFKLVFLPEYTYEPLPEEELSQWERLYYEICNNFPYYLPPNFTELLPEERVDTTFETCFNYVVRNDGYVEYYERILLEVEIVNGEAKILSETHEYYVNNEWSTTRPVTE